MALEDILRVMEQQARAEIARVQMQAEAEAAAIIAKAEEEAKAIKARHLTNVMPRLQNDRARLLNEAKLVALREVMATREALLDDAFAMAHTELARLRENRDYPGVLARLTREVVDELGRELNIVVDPRDEKVIQKVAAELGMHSQISTGLHTAGGLEASTPDGRVTVVNTVEARLARSQRYLRREIASILVAEDVSWKATMTMPMPASGR